MSREVNHKRHKHGKSERHGKSSSKHHSSSHSRSRHLNPDETGALSPHSADVGSSPSDTPHTPAPGMFAAPVAQVTLPWGCGAFLGPAVTVPIQGTNLPSQDSADDTNEKSRHHGVHKKHSHHGSDMSDLDLDEVRGHRHGESSSADAKGHRKRHHHHHHSHKGVDGSGDGKGHRHRGHHHGDGAGDAESGEVRGHRKKGHHHHDRAEDSRHRSKRGPSSTHSERSKSHHRHHHHGDRGNHHGNGEEFGDNWNSSPNDRIDVSSRQTDRSSSRLSQSYDNTKQSDSLRDTDRGSETYMSDELEAGEIQSSCSNDEDFEGGFNGRRGSVDRWDDRRSAVKYDADDWERGSDRMSSRGGRAGRGTLLLDDRSDDGYGYDDRVRSEDNGVWDYDGGARRGDRGGRYSSRDRGVPTMDDEMRDRRDREKAGHKSRRPDKGFEHSRNYGSLDRVDSNSDLMRHGSYSDFGSLNRSGERFHSDSRLDVAAKGRTGALLIEDGNKKVQGGHLPKERKLGRSGALLIEDKKDSRTDTLLIEDRIKQTGGYMPKEKKLGRSGALLIEDKKESRSGALLIEDRNEGRQRTRLIEDGKESRAGSVSVDDRKEVRQGALLIEDRNWSKPHIGKDMKEGRSGALLIEDKYDGRGRPRTSDDRKESRTGALLLEDRVQSRSGALLLEDRKESRSGALLLEDRKESRSGALLLEDRNESRSDSLPTEDRKRGRSGALLLEDRNDSRSGAPFIEGRIEDRGDKRSRPLTLEDRKGRSGALLFENERNPILRDDRDPSNGRRKGAMLIEDRDQGLRGERTMKDSDKGQNLRDKQGLRNSSLSRETTTQRPMRRSDASDQGRGVKRSWSSSNFQDRMQTSRSPGRDDGEAIIKRRRRREPSEEPSAPKCVRSGTPPPGDPTEEDYYIEPPSAWVRCSAADLYFTRDNKTGNMVTTKRMRDLENKFEHDILQRGPRIRIKQEPYEKPKQLQPKWQQKGRCPEHNHHQHHPHGHADGSSSSSDDDTESDSDCEEWWLEEMRRKQNHPQRLHKELWYNDPGELNYGPLCRCSYKARKTGIRHDKYPGEMPIPKCDINSNNLNQLFHYKITVSPVTNFLTKHPTIIMFDGHEYIFEGFSIFTHSKIPPLPPCQVIRFNIVYTIHVIEEQAPENFSIRNLDMLSDFLFTEILELVDIDWKGPGTDEHCKRFHVMPRFARPFPENGKEVLSMNDILLYLLKSSKPVIEPTELPNLLRLDQDSWQKFVDGFRHMVVTSPGKKPSSIRIDQLDKQLCSYQDKPEYPLIIHHGLRPAQLSYAGDPMYKRKWREYMKFRHLIWCKTKPGAGDKEKLEEFEMDLQKIRLSCTMKREVTVETGSKGFLLTGIRSDICQHAMLLPVLFGHVRFHDCLGEMEKRIGHTFKDRSLLHLAMTHSSYKINYGTNHDHGRNSMSNCGSRQREFGDQRTITQHTRKRGLNILLRIMSKFGNKKETRSDIPHNERLEFLGDAVVEFITSIHLFYMFPFADEGEMTTYRGSLVQNNHLAVLADKLRLQDFLLYAHGPDLCNDSALKHAMANCFEALIGALFLDGGVPLADKVFSKALFQTEDDLLDIWTELPPHPLIQDEPHGDRHWIITSPALQKLVTFEEEIGYEFRFMRLLAKALTQPNVGYNHLTLGHNQRLEFLGDTIMQLISSSFLFRHFPDHHEGHLTLLRSSLVNNKTQAIVADELGLTDFVISSQSTAGQKMKQKERADLLESLFGAMFVDGGLEPCKILCDVCFFPRLEQFILNQDWNDPKSQLQQCCLTLRDMNEESPAVPVYKVLKKSGPANTRRYTVGVYFRGKRLAVGEGGSIQQGEMEAAEAALSQNKALFPNRFRFSDKLLKSGFLKVEPVVKEAQVAVREGTL